MADVNSLKAEALMELRLVHPANGKYFGITVNLRGPDSPDLKKVNAKHREEMLRGGRFKLNANKLDRNGEELLVAAIASWTFELDEDGEQATLDGEEKPDCNDKNKLKLVRSLLGKQIDSALEDETAFISAT